MIFVGFPMYQPPSFLSPLPKITEKKFISGLTFSDSSPIWLIWELETSLQVFLLMCSVDRHWFPSFRPWAHYSSICWDFLLVISQLFFFFFKRCWIITATLSGCFSLFMLFLDHSVCYSPEKYFVISSASVKFWHPTDLLSWEVSCKCFEYVPK